MFLKGFAFQNPGNLISVWFPKWKPQKIQIFCMLSMVLCRKRIIIPPTKPFFHSSQGEFSFWENVFGLNFFRDFAIKTNCMAAVIHLKAPSIMFGELL